MNNKTVIELDKVCKNYHRGSEEVHAVRDVTLSLGEGEYWSIVGPSGSGKTTLMNLMGCLDHPSSGLIRVNGTEIEHANETVLTQFRRKTIGFVFQQFFLIPTLTVLQNTRLPSLFAGKETHERAEELLGLVGLEKRMEHLPGQLSGGEMQRVAIARSLINDPPIVLADEPTGNLDSANAEGIMKMLGKVHDDGKTVVIVTHNQELAKRSERIIRIEDGLVTA